MTSFFLGFSPPSTAHSQVRVTVGEIDLAGELTNRIEEDVAWAIAEGLGRAEILVTTREGEGDVHVRVDAAVSLDTQVYAIELELIRLADDAVLATESSACEICTRAEALTAIGIAAEALAESLPGLAVVNVVPDDAWLEIDGATVSAGVPVALTPGVHRVVAMLEEHADAEREITVTARETTELTLTLDPLIVSQGSSGGRPLWLAGWIVGGVGLATLVGGGVLWGVDGRICDPDSPVDSAGNCARLYSTWREGVTLTAIGIGALAAGAILLVIERLRRRPATSRRPTLASEWGPMRGPARAAGY